MSVPGPNQKQYNRSKSNKRSQINMYANLQQNMKGSFHDNSVTSRDGIEQGVDVVPGSVSKRDHQKNVVN